MKNRTLSLLVAAGAFALGAMSASATEYRDADNWGATVIGSGLSVSQEFDITALPETVADALQADAFTVTAPYTGPQGLGDSHTSALGYTPGTPITDGYVYFWLRDAGGDTITITVGLGAILTSAGGGPVVFLSEGLNVTLIADLTADGIIAYTVLNSGPSSVIFDYALLTANVPDGGLTLSLLGSALVGLGLLRRKLS